MQNQQKQNVAIELMRTEYNYKIVIEIVRPCVDLREKYFNESDRKIITKARIGPDEILAFLEGVSLQVEVAASENFCNRYHAYFQLPLSGPHRLKIVRLRTDYTASRNHLPFHPAIDYEVFLDKLIPSEFVQLIPRPCSSFSIFDHLYPLHAINGYWMSSSNQLSTLPLSVEQDCDDGNDLKRGLPKLQTYAKPSIEFGMNKNCAEDVNNYRWNRRICSYKKKPSMIKDNDLLAEVVDTSSDKKTDLTSQNRDYSGGKSILFVGDANMRTLAELFLRQVCRYQDVIHLDASSTTKVQFVELSKSAAIRYKKTHEHDCLSKNKERSSSFYDNEDTCGELYDKGCASLYVGYLGESKCGMDMTVHFSQFNYVVMNCGQGQAASIHSTYETYRNSISNLLTSIQNAQLRETTLLFWVESVAPPLRQSASTSNEYSDRRAYHRMLLYHQIVQEEMLAKGMRNKVALIPAFQSTLALFDKMCDCMTYPPAAMTPQLIGLVDSIRKANNQISHLIKAEEQAKARATSATTSTL